MNYPTFRFPLITLTIVTLVLFCTAYTFAEESGLHGRILGHDETGEFAGVVGDAVITFESTSGMKQEETVSDKNGYYRIALPPGEFNYEISANGYRTEQSGRGIRLGQGEGFAVANFSLTKGTNDPKQSRVHLPKRTLGRLIGRVLERTSGGLIGVSNARIALRREGSKSPIYLESIANGHNIQDKGRYAGELDAGKYSIAVVADGFEVLREDTPIQIIGNRETTKDFILIRKAMESSSEEGIRGNVSIVGSDREHPSIHVTLQSLTEAEHTTMELPIANNGGFKQLLEPGCYRITASAEGFPTVVSPPTFVLPGRFSQVSLTLHSRAVPESKTSLDVFVFEKNQAGNEVPLNNVLVSVLKANAGDQAAIEARSDATGHAKLPLTHEGTYTVSAFLSGYNAGSSTGHVDLGQLHEVGIELVRSTSAATSTHSIEVSAIDAVSRTPLVGAKLLARQASDTLAETVRTTTDVHGSATLTVKKTGKYSVLAQHAGYLPKSGATEVSLTEPSRLVIALDPIRSQPMDQTPHVVPSQQGASLIQGVVAYRELDGRLHSIPATKITWQRTLPLDPPVNSFTVTGSDGKYLAKLPAGTYQARVQPPPGFESTLEEIQINSVMLEKYFLVERSASSSSNDRGLRLLSGRVVTETMGGAISVPQAHVQVLRMSIVEQATTDARGEFKFRLPDDSYRLLIQARGYSPIDLTVKLDINSQPLVVELKRVNSTPTDSDLTVTVIQQIAAAGAGPIAIAGATVHVTLDGKEVASGIADRSGQLSNRLKPGNYQVSVDKLGFSTSFKNIEVKQANVIEQISLTPTGVNRATPPQTTLTVQVNQRALGPSANIRTTGVPLAGANVTVMQGTQQIASGLTNAAGSYSAHLQPGLYSVKAEAKGFSPAGRSIKFSTSSAKVDILLDRSNTAVGNSGISNLNDILRPADRLEPDKLPGILRDPNKGSGGSTWYVVEYRLSVQSPWIAIATKPTQQDANAALFLAIDRGRIPKTAQTRIRVKHLTAH